MRRPLRHGPAGYARGCRCEACVTGRRVYVKRLEIRRTQGPLLLPADGTVRLLTAALAAGIPQGVIAEKAGMSTDQMTNIINRQNSNIRRLSADAIRKALTQLVAERRAALSDVQDVLDYLDGRNVKVRGLWPVDTLREAIRAEFDSIKAAPLNDSDRRNLYRAKKLDTATVDRMCLGLGILPESVYGPAWWGLEAAS